MLWRREAAWGCVLGAALGAGFRVGQWLLELGIQRDLTPWMPLVYIALLALVGGVSGVLWANLREQAITDALTGLYNRRYFHTVLEREIARAQRTGSPLSVLILDIDDFKSINDRFGHQEGDRVLQRVADILRRASRGSDLVVRWGGEEFAVILPDISAEGAQRAGHRLAEVVLVNTGVPLSVGWATFPDEPPDELLEKADQRMYQHKRAKSTGKSVEFA